MVRGFSLKRLRRRFRSSCSVWLFTGSERYAATGPVRDTLFQQIPHNLCKEFQKPPHSTRDLNKVSEVCHFVCASAGNRHHRGPKTPVVEHKGNATHLTADWSLRAASPISYTVHSFARFVHVCARRFRVTGRPFSHLQSRNLWYGSRRLSHAGCAMTQS